MVFETRRIKQKIISNDPKRWWGDDFDVRFYLISELKKINGKKILDIGGGIGIISSEIDPSNERINVDFSYDELKTCNKTDKGISTACADMTNLPFSKNTFDVVISSSVLQYAKDTDVKNSLVVKKNDGNEYPHVEKAIMEIKRVLKQGGKLLLVTPNNAYYNSYMLNYDELNKSLKKHFTEYKISLYNTFPKLSKKYRKLNLANVIPKILSKIVNEKKLIRGILIKKKITRSKCSVSFYVEAEKRE